MQLKTETTTIRIVGIKPRRAEIQIPATDLADR